MLQKAWCRRVGLERACRGAAGAHTVEREQKTADRGVLALDQRAHDRFEASLGGNPIQARAASHSSQPMHELVGMDSRVRIREHGGDGTEGRDPKVEGIELWMVAND